MSAAPLLVALVQVTVAVVLAPLVIGVTRQTRARLEGRVGPGVLQPARDLRKLIGKTPLRAAGTSPMTVVAPVVLLTSSLLLAALVPLVAALPLALVPGDLFVVVSVLLVGTVAIALLGLDGGSAFGGMGSSRHMTIAALVEPTVLVAVYALSIPVGSSALPLIVAARRDHPASIASPAGVLAVVALAIVVLAETGRLPIDNPSTHLELTMIHEAMVLETSGRDLAWVDLASWLRLSVLLGLVGNLLLPWGVAGSAAPGPVLLGALALAGKLALLAVLLATVEVAMAKLRLFRVPELLAGSFVLAFLAVTASYLVA
ncbi:MAG: formate hydrogenlyase [Cellulomonas sp. 73-92]|uniref:respiratory chain complex I subunit 1 family protein n=1 Tax=Cellulomonas sp. 73-92 TaxID=1895740 RepID=UPI00092728B3|nr:NADH-quinone oxidoreductase subunit H [Cellulomonas sp. 73-92]OJV83473.1 MAG: formate hydrogenlyase [Cellulomonas sp. 73-92]